MDFDLKDIEITIWRDARPCWRGRGIAVLQPIGIYREFDISWDDESAIENAISDIEREAKAR